MTVDQALEYMSNKTVKELEGIYLTLPFSEWEQAGKEAKQLLKAHYDGNKLSIERFFAVKGVEIQYNYRRHAEKAASKKAGK